MSIIYKHFVQQCNQSNVRVRCADGCFVDSLGSAECTISYESFSTSMMCLVFKNVFEDDILCVIKIVFVLLGM